jgi:hypothetical protein
MKKVPAFWLEPHVVNKLRHLRGAGESYSDVILRMASVPAVDRRPRARLASGDRRHEGSWICSFLSGCGDFGEGDVGP